MNANELMGELVADHKAEIIEKAASKLAARLAKVCLPDAEKLVRQKMEEAAGEMVAKQLADISTLTFRKTDSYGYPREEHVLTLPEVIRREAVEWLEVRVCSRGETSFGTKDRSRAQFLAQQAAEALVKGELEPAIKQAKADLKAAVEGKLSKAFVEALRQCK